MDKEIKRIEKYAKEHNVPIMEKTGIEFLTEYIKEHNVKNILEIGTAIGYSAIKMALVDDKIKVTTIERDNERYLEALKNIGSKNLQSAQIFLGMLPVTVIYPFVQKYFIKGITLGGVKE